MTDLVLTKVSKAFGGVTAASNVSLQIPKGKITAIIGPNGAGKTTLINLVTGMLALSSGEITLGDIPLTHEPAYVVGRLGVARTFQNIRLLADETVTENIMIGFYRIETSSVVGDLFGFPASRLETKRTRQRAHALLDRFGMRRYENHLAGSLSYGDQRRVEMMRAIAGEPKVLLLDEPVAGMNEVEAEEMGKMFVSLARSGVAVLVIEHNMRFISAISDFAYVLDQGRVIAEGTPKAVLSNDKVISAYLGS